MCHPHRIKSLEFQIIPAALSFFFWRGRAGESPPHFFSLLFKSKAAAPNSQLQLMGSPLEAMGTILLPPCFEVCISHSSKPQRCFLSNDYRQSLALNFLEGLNWKNLWRTVTPPHFLPHAFHSLLNWSPLDFFQLRKGGCLARKHESSQPPSLAASPGRRTQIPHWNICTKGCVMLCLRRHHSSSERMAMQRTVFDPLHVHSTSYAAFCWAEEMELEHSTASSSLNA